ncbi:hypothetical protein [Sphingopyxis sp.]|uniref:hypothetical protein n=1 Tax=Sphingopyxis sp. TaxID=1908224 RepID=UPI003D0BEBFB
MFGQSLHWLTLPLAALDKVSFGFIEIDELREPKRGSLGVSFRRWIGAHHRFGEKLACPLSRFIEGQNAEATNRDGPCRGDASATIGAMANVKMFWFLGR